MGIKAKNIALYFGSFNPVHRGHISVAQYIIKNCDIDRFFMVLSPHNPFKDKELLQSASQRLKDLKDRVALISREEGQNAPNSIIEVSDIEFNLPEPRYTFNTMLEFQKQFPNDNLIIVAGADTLQKMPTWYKGEELLRRYKVIVYPRKGYSVKRLVKKYGIIYLDDAPLYNLSSTEVRAGKYSAF